MFRPPGPAYGAAQFGLLPVDPADLFRGFREASVQAMCATPGQVESALRTIANDALVMAHTKFVVRPTNTTRPSVMQQLINYLGLYGARDACLREARAQMNRQTIAVNFVNEAAAIVLRLLDVTNPQQAVLRLSYEVLYFMRQRQEASRLDCLAYLSSQLGIDRNFARVICARTGDLVNPPAGGIRVDVPVGFYLSDALIELAKFASDYLIQPPPPGGTRLPSIQIPPPMR